MKIYIVIVENTETGHIKEIRCYKNSNMADSDADYENGLKTKMHAYVVERQLAI
jgi:hypothetical protein